MSTVLKETLTRLAATGGKRGKGLVICVAAGNNNCPVKDLQNSDTYEYLSNGIRRTYSGAHRSLDCSSSRCANGQRFDIAKDALVLFVMGCRYRCVCANGQLGRHGAHQPQGPGHLDYR